MMTPLPDRRTGLTYAFVPGTGFTGEGEITTGKHTGERFGVDGTPGPDSYLVKDGRKRHKGGLAARIYAPSVQYFTEFSFRIREASRVGYVDDAQWNGRRYHRVLATWGDVRAHMKHDQYLVYVNAESKLIDLVRYTIRTAGPPMASAIAFTDVRDVGGMKLAFDVQVGFFSDDGLRTIHHLDVDEIVAAR